jgi:hypothetical protein
MIFLGCHGREICGLMDIQKFWEWKSRKNGKVLMFMEMGVEEWLKRR